MDNPCVVIDNGSGSCKVGLSGGQKPKSRISTMVGKPKIPAIMVGMDQKQLFMGSQVQQKRGILNISSPITHGIIDDWSSMTKLWHHIFYSQLKVPSKQHPCLLTQVALNPVKNRQKMAEIMFQTFDVPSLYITGQAVLSCYAAGKISGLILDSGHGVTSIVPIYQGYQIKKAIQRNNFAGNQLTQILAKMLKNQGVSLDIKSDHLTLNDIKQKHCYLTLDNYSSETQVKNECQYKLPDGSIISLGKQLTQCPQALFKPPSNLQLASIPQLIQTCISKCDMDIRKDLYSTIILSGGSTIFPGFKNRLLKDLKQFVPQKVKEKLNVIDLQQKQDLAWIGGSILSSMATFQAMWISKSQFVDVGTNIVYQKCF